MLSSQLPHPIAIIDVETTGLFPLRYDRVVEVAAIVIEGDGQIVREFVSLVNPGRDIGPTSIHKAKKARMYGIRIMHELVFWKAIGVNVE